MKRNIQNDFYDVIQKRLERGKRLLLKMNDVNPINYKIHLEPDLKEFKFAGNTEIIMEAMRPVNEISLNILDLAIWRCKLKLADSFVDCPFFVDPKKEEMRVSLPDEISG